MAIVHGRYNTASRYGGTFYNFEEETILVEVSIVRLNVRTFLEDPQTDVFSHFLPRVTHTNMKTSVVTDLTGDVIEVSYDMSLDSGGDSFSVTLTDAAKWSPQGAINPGLLAEGVVHFQIDLYIDLYTQDGVLPVHIMSGPITDVDEEYARPASKLTISNRNMSELLRANEGDANGDGSIYHRMARVVEIMRQRMIAGGTSQLFVPSLFQAAIKDEMIELQNMYARNLERNLKGLNASSAGRVDVIVQPLRITLKDLERWHVGSPGIGHDGGSDTRWVYDTRKNIQPPLRLTSSIAARATAIEVVGGTTSGSGRVEGPQPDIVNYWTRLQALQSNMVILPEQRDQSGADLLEKSKQGQRSLGLDLATLNPLLRPGDVLVLGDVPVDQGGVGSWINGLEYVVTSLRGTLLRDKPVGSMSVDGYWREP